MTTTDSNGIVFLEDTDPISPFHTLMNTLQQGTSDALTPLNGLLGYVSAPMTSAGVGGTEAAVSGVSVVLTPGKWEIVAKGIADWSVGSGGVRYSIRLRENNTSGTELDYVTTYIGGTTTASVPWFLMKTNYTVSANTTVVLTAQATGGVGGGTSLDRVQMSASRKG